MSLPEPKPDTRELNPAPKDPIDSTADMEERSELGEVPSVLGREPPDVAVCCAPMGLMGCWPPVPPTLTLWKS